jgi:NADPH:quinone reductase-like Zn-dependent oxidoreductase
MKAIQITGTDGLASLKLNEIPTPDPEHGEVLIRIRAACLNFRDYMNVMGIRGVSGPIPRVPCSDGAGEIAALGAGVTNWRIGERVVVPFMPQWVDGEMLPAYQAAALGAQVDGMLREYATVPASSLVQVPDYLSLEEAATLPCAAVTAWNALTVRGQLKPGETVLILGAGGVSVFALQLAKLAGARVFAITSTEEKAERLRQLGAEAVHNYRTDPAWDEWALSVTDGVGMDKVIEVGGPDTLNKSLRATRFGGHIALIGVLTGTSGEIQTVQILRKSIRLDGVYVGSRAMFVDLLKAMKTHEMRPIIDSTFALADAADAFKRIESGEHIGKIVVKC